MAGIHPVNSLPPPLHCRRREENLLSLRCRRRKNRTEERQTDPVFLENNGHIKEHSNSFKTNIRLD
jgi:hypothetical protein